MWLLVFRKEKKQKEFQICLKIIIKKKSTLFPNYFTLTSTTASSSFTKIQFKLVVKKFPSPTLFFCKFNI